jgi:CheY-like chemotaxis protein
MAPRVTVVNDNPEFLELMHDVLEGDRYDATAIDGDAPDAVDLIRASSPDVLIVDLRLGQDGIRGWEISQQVRRDPDFSGLPILVCSGDLAAIDELAAQLDDTRRVATLPKPFAIDELTAALDRLLAEPIGG